jgi:hypothetical protein
LAGCPAAPAQQVPPAEAPVYGKGPPPGEAGPSGGSSGAPAPAPEPGALVADGESCYAGSECQSGACEGEGCGVEQPGTCVAASRACRGAEQPFCSCGGQSFRAPSDCPGQRFAKRTSCAQAEADAPPASAPR